MEIGVVTPWDSNNAGAFLQAYALKAYLEQGGHTVFHLKFRSGRSARRLFYRLRPSRAQLLDLGSYREDLAFGKAKYRRFREEAACFSTIDPEDAKTLGLILLGSDEIWNVRHQVFRDPVFFGQGFESVIAYAPSIGACERRDFDGHADRLEDIRKLRAVMVRDEKTADLVESITAQRPRVVVDPTLLHVWEDRPVQARDELLPEEPYLLVYAYSTTHVPVTGLKEYSRRHGLRLVSAGFRHDWCDSSVNCSPMEFLDVLDRAESVFTTTFHGTIFSILAGKQFVAVPGSPKTVDLLSKFGLSSRIPRSPVPDSQQIESVLLDPVGRDAVDTLIANRRAESRVLLDTALLDVLHGAGRAGDVVASSV